MFGGSRPAHKGTQDKDSWTSHALESGSLLGTHHMQAPHKMHLVPISAPDSDVGRSAGSV